MSSGKKWSGIGTGGAGKWWGHHLWKYSKGVWMWHLSLWWAWWGWVSSRIWWSWSFPSSVILFFSFSVILWQSWKRCLPSPFMSAISPHAQSCCWDVNFPVPGGYIQLLSKRRVKQRNPPCTHRAAPPVSAAWSSLEWPFCAAAVMGVMRVVYMAGFIILFSLGFFLKAAFHEFILLFLLFHLGTGGRRLC